MFSWMNAHRGKQNKDVLEILPYEIWWDKLQKEVIQSKADKKRLDKLSGLLLFRGGVPNSSMCYVVENSMEFGKVNYPVITEKSFEEFISNMVLDFK